MSEVYDELGWRLSEREETEVPKGSCWNPYIWRKTHSGWGGGGETSIRNSDLAGVQKAGQREGTG